MSRNLLALLIVTMLGYSFPHLSFASDDGAKVYQESCAPCHTAKMRPLDNILKTKEEWKDVVERMIDQGAEVPKRGKDALLDYLSSTHGPSRKATDADKK